MLCRDLYELDWERRGRQALLDIFSTMTMQQVSSKCVEQVGLGRCLQQVCVPRRRWRLATAACTHALPGHTVLLPALSAAVRDGGL